MATANDVMAYLNRNRVSFTVRRHVPAYTAAALAAVNHMRDSEVARTWIVDADGKLWMAVIPGDREFDIDALRVALHAGVVRRLDGLDIQELFPNCNAEALPPLGNLFGLGVIVDNRFEQAGQMVFSACTHSASITMAWDEFRRLARPICAPITEPVGELKRQGT